MRTFFVSLLPENCSLKSAGGFFNRLVAWSEIQGGEQLHDRFVLTEKDETQFGGGLGAINRNENVAVSLLETDHASRLRARFAVHSQTHQKIG